MLYVLILHKPIDSWILSLPTIFNPSWHYSQFTICSFNNNDKNVKMTIIWLFQPLR